MNGVGGLLLHKARKKGIKKDDSQNQTHQKPTTVPLSFSSKKLMTEHVTAFQALSAFGDLSQVNGVFTFIERWWLRSMLLRVTNAANIIDINAVTKDTVKKVQEVSRSKFALVTIFVLTHLYFYLK